MTRHSFPDLREFIVREMFLADSVVREYPRVREFYAGLWFRGHGINVEDATPKEKKR